MTSSAYTLAIMASWYKKVMQGLVSSVISKQKASCGRALDGSGDLIRK